MMPKYVFDTNIFIELQQKQPRESYPSVWNKIEELMNDGTIVSSQEVLDELSCGDDALVKWAKERRKFFLPSERPIQEKVREILAKHRGLVEGGKKRNNADPFVIALAKENNCAVVTGEVKTNSINAPKIPDVCVLYGVKSLNFVEFLQDMKIMF